MNLVSQAHSLYVDFPLSVSLSDSLAAIFSGNSCCFFFIHSVQFHNMEKRWANEYLHVHSCERRMIKGLNMNIIASRILILCVYLCVCLYEMFVIYHIECTIPTIVCIIWLFIFIARWMISIFSRTKTNKPNLGFVKSNQNLTLLLFLCEKRKKNKQTNEEILKSRTHIYFFLYRLVCTYS